MHARKGEKVGWEELPSAQFSGMRVIELGAEIPRIFANFPTQAWCSLPDSAS